MVGLKGFLFPSLFFLPFCMFSTPEHTCVLQFGRQKQGFCTVTAVTMQALPPHRLLCCFHEQAPQSGTFWGLDPTPSAHPSLSTAVLLHPERCPQLLLALILAPHRSLLRPSHQAPVTICLRDSSYKCPVSLGKITLHT